MMLQNILEETHIKYMQVALNQAYKALDKEEVPIGSVIVCNEIIIAKGYNQTQLLKDATAHAEMLAITQAAYSLKSKYIENATIYCTIEPCLMCWGAILNTKIRNVCFGVKEPKMGFTSLVKEIPNYMNIKGGILQNECAELIIQFFKNKRK